MKLKDLPIKPDDSGGDEVVSGYIKERDAVKTVADLKAFVGRWKTVWDPNTFQNVNYSACEQSLFDGTFDAEQALKCLNDCRGQGCEHVKANNKNGCAGVYIALPVVFMQVALITDKFGVPSDIAIIQMFGGFGELYGEDPVYNEEK